MRETTVGELRVDLLSAGRFSLDGGAMFGVVPKPRWERLLPADERNRVRMGLNCLLVTAKDGTRVLCDTGLGSRWTQDEREQLDIDDSAGLLDELAALGHQPEDIDVVVCSHLHFDHAGGAVKATASGELEATFPEAKYIVQEIELEHARSPHERDRASYRPDDFEPLDAAGQLELVSGSQEVAPGVFVDLVPGHCPGMQVVRLESEGQGLVFPADLMPTAAHVRPAWNMAYDLDVTATVAAKRELLERVVDRDWLVCFDHDPAQPLVRLRTESQSGRHHVVADPA